VNNFQLLQTIIGEILGVEKLFPPFLKIVMFNFRIFFACWAKMVWAKTLEVYRKSV